MKVKIFSVRADQSFRPRLPQQEQEARTKASAKHMAGKGDPPPAVTADTYLERIIQEFLDQHPNIQVRHVEFASLAVWPPDENTVNDDPRWRWPVEKSVLILYEDGV